MFDFNSITSLDLQTIIMIGVGLFSAVAGAVLVVKMVIDARRGKTKPHKRKTKVVVPEPPKLNGKPEDKRDPTDMLVLVDAFNKWKASDECRDKND